MTSDGLKLIYLVTIRPSISPHVVPMRAYVDPAGKIYVATERKSVKVKNILNNNKVALVIPTSDYHEVIMEGDARIVNDDEIKSCKARTVFEHQHPWKLTFGKRSTYVLVEITPTKTMNR